MDKVIGRLTVFFDEPFWVGVFERIDKEKLSVCRVTFWAEPKDYDIWEFVLKNYCDLKFSPAVEVAVRPGSSNPKRRQRIARKQTLQKGVGTKAQQAMQLQREAMKTRHQQVSKEEREADQQRRFELRQQKRKEKHRGR